MDFISIPSIAGSWGSNWLTPFDFENTAVILDEKANDSPVLHKWLSYSDPVTLIEM